MTELKKLTAEEFDNLRAVLTCLRHHCEGVEKLEDAADIISNKLELSKDEVNSYLQRIFKGK